jgi:DeoR family transcriptional regulator of aga operon
MRCVTALPNDPGAQPYSGRRTERLAAILDLLSTHGSIDVASAAGELGVSCATIRRDLAVLSSQYLLKRTHGGATSRDLAYEVPVRFREGHEREAKLRIAAACADAIARRPQAIAMSGGTTTTEVARQLADRSELTIVTNAVNIAFELSLWPRLRVIVAGGQIRSESYEMVGAWTERFLEGLNFSVTVMGCDGISATGGITTHDPVEARADQKMVERAERVIVVADRTKVGTVTMAKLADVATTHMLITDHGASPGAVAALRAKGVEVRLV